MTGREWFLETLHRIAPQVQDGDIHRCRADLDHRLQHGDGAVLRRDIDVDVRRPDRGGRQGNAQRPVAGQLVVVRRTHAAFFEQVGNRRSTGISSVGHGDLVITRRQATRQRSHGRFSGERKPPRSPVARGVNAPGVGAVRVVEVAIQFVPRHLGIAGQGLHQRLRVGRGRDPVNG